MRGLSLAVGLAVVLGVIGGATPASAQGVHIGAGPVHVDVGQPHGRGYDYAPYRRSSWSYGGNYRAYYPAPYQRRTVFYGGHQHWHDTTHYDYHPGEYVPHRGHYHYVPGHYDLHRSGHWDTHYGGHYDDHSYHH